jgi:ketosteroid isomerase-like protein
VPRTTAGSQDARQRVPSTWLSVLAGALLALALLLGYIGGAVLDPQHFAHRATTALDDAAVRAEVASAVTGAISSAGGSAVPSAQVSSAVDEVIGEPRFGREFRAAIVKVHTALVEQGKSSATLDLSSIGPLVAKRLQGANPGMAAPSSVPPVRLEIDPPSAVRSVVKVLHSLSWLPAVLGLLALGLFAAFIVRAADRLGALRRAAITILVTGIALLVLYLILRELVPNATSNSDVAGGIAGAYFGDFAIASLVLAGAGALGWLGATRTMGRAGPPAPARPRKPPAAPVEPDSQAATRVLTEPQAARGATDEDLPGLRRDRPRGRARLQALRLPLRAAALEQLRSGDNRPMSAENVETIRRGFDHFQAEGDFDPEITAADFVWDMSTFAGWPEQRTYDGIEGARQFLRDWLDAWEEWELEVEDFRDAGEKVVVIARQHGRSKATGLEVDMHFAQVFTVRDGKQVRMEMYADPAAALEAVGLREG